METEFEAGFCLRAEETLLLPSRSHCWTLKLLVQVSLNLPCPLVMSARWACPFLLPRHSVQVYQRPLLPMPSSHRSSYAAAAASGSGAPSPPAGPPAPPSTRTQPLPGAAQPRHASAPPPSYPQTAGWLVEVGRGGGCQGLLVVRTRRIWTGSGSSGSEEETPHCSLDEESRSHCLVANHIL